MKRSLCLFAGVLLMLDLTEGATKRTAKTAGKSARVRLLDAASVNNTEWTGVAGAARLRAQILLARAHFSPGEIDGQGGNNFKRALRGFQAVRQIPATGTLDRATWTELNVDAAPALTEYTITEEDIAGPFAEIPEDMMEQSKLPALGYATAEEFFGEKFHLSPVLLKRLNPKATLTAGQKLQVPDFGTPAQGKAVKVLISKSGTVQAFDAQGVVLAQYPSSSGSEHDPLPLGTWKVTLVQRNPAFYYNPALFWDADTSHSKAKIPAGPNNPVGSVWIDLTKEHYGIHGTPVPANVGHTQSHGCIRLTNWDVKELGGLVAKGTEVICQE